MITATNRDQQAQRHGSKTESCLLDHPIARLACLLAELLYRFRVGLITEGRELLADVFAVVRLAAPARSAPGVSAEALVETAAAQLSRCLPGECAYAANHVPVAT